MKASQTLLAWVFIFVILGTVFYTVSSEELDQIEAAEEDVLRKQELLARLNGLPAKEEIIRQQLESLNSVAATKYMYEGNKRNTQIVMQRDVRQLAAQAGVQLGSMRTLGIANDLERLKRALIQANFVTTNDKLLDFLLVLEAWEPLLRVQRISIRVRQPSTVEREASLAVMLEIAGFHQEEEVGQ